jgi:hypothetical protein
MVNEYVLVVNGRVMVMVMVRVGVSGKVRFGLRVTTFCWSVVGQGLDHIKWIVSRDLKRIKRLTDGFIRLIISPKWISYSFYTVGFYTVTFYTDIFYTIILYAVYFLYGSFFIRFTSYTVIFYMVVFIRFNIMERFRFKSYLYK